MNPSLDTTTVRAFRILQDDQQQVRGRICSLTVAELSAGDVLVRTAFAGINYKDALAATTAGKVIRQFPRIGGLDFSGVVLASGDPRFKPGDAVLAHSRGLGVEHDGGFSTHVRLPGDWVRPLPAGLSLQDAAAIGVAGYSAALCIELMERQGLRPGNGPVAISGASGAVASHAIDMLARLGHEVHAISRKATARERLLALGAQQVHGEVPDGGKPLDKALWAGAIDSVGGPVLDALLRTTRPKGVVAAIGNAGGNALATNVLPFILRSVSLLGVSLMTHIDLQPHLWQRLAGDLKPSGVLSQTRSIALDDLPGHLEKVLAGQVDGRVIVALD